MQMENGSVIRMAWLTSVGHTTPNVEYNAADRGFLGAKHLRLSGYAEMLRAFSMLTLAAQRSAVIRANPSRLVSTCTMAFWL
jgi:hypothetical protein